MSMGKAVNLQNSAQIGMKILLSDKAPYATY